MSAKYGVTNMPLTFFSTKHPHQASVTLLKEKKTCCTNQQPVAKMLLSKPGKSRSVTAFWSNVVKYSRTTLKLDPQHRTYLKGKCVIFKALLPVTTVIPFSPNSGEDYRCTAESWIFIKTKLCLVQTACQIGQSTQSQIASSYHMTGYWQALYRLKGYFLNKSLCSGH